MLSRRNFFSCIGYRYTDWLLKMFLRKGWQRKYYKLRTVAYIRYLYKYNINHIIPTNKCEWKLVLLRQPRLLLCLLLLHFEISFIVFTLYAYTQTHVFNVDFKYIQQHLIVLFICAHTILFWVYWCTYDFRIR